MNRNNISSCIPRDTTINESNLFVRYINHGSFFDIEIGGEHWQKNLGYRFDCNMPQSIIPRYEWSNKSIIAFVNGCGGSYCNTNTYFNIETKTIYKRENVLISRKEGSLIAYLDGDTSLVVENIASLYKQRFDVGCSPPCANTSDCIKEIKFSKTCLSINWVILDINKNEKTILKKYYLNKVFN